MNSMNKYANVSIGRLIDLIENGYPHNTHTLTRLLQPHAHIQAKTHLCDVALERLRIFNDKLNVALISKNIKINWLSFFMNINHINYWFIVVHKRCVCIGICERNGMELFWLQKNRPRCGQKNHWTQKWIWHEFKMRHNILMKKCYLFDVECDISCLPDLRKNGNFVKDIKWANDFIASNFLTKFKATCWCCNVVLSYVNMVIVFWTKWIIYWVLNVY